MSHNDEHPTVQVEQLLEKVNFSLGLSDPRPFSPAGFEAVKERIAQYISDLVTESVRVSKRLGGDTVSAANVHQAGNYLVQGSTRRMAKYFGTFGGLIGGAGISSLLSLGTSPTPASPAALLVSAGAAIVGMFLIGFQLASD